MPAGQQGALACFCLLGPASGQRHRTCCSWSSSVQLRVDCLLLNLKSCSLLYESSRNSYTCFCHTDSLSIAIHADYLDGIVHNACEDLTQLRVDYFVLPPSTKERNYWIRVSQINSSLIKFIVNSISIYVSK